MDQQLIFHMIQEMWMWCCRTRTGHMLALSFAVAIVLMCKGHLEDKYRGLCVIWCMLYYLRLMSCSTVTVLQSELLRRPFLSFLHNNYRQQYYYYRYSQVSIHYLQQFFFSLYSVYDSIIIINNNKMFCFERSSIYCSPLLLICRTSATALDYNVIFYARSLELLG